jgi:hypothetical protein
LAICASFAFAVANAAYAFQGVLEALVCYVSSWIILQISDKEAFAAEEADSECGEETPLPAIRVRLFLASPSGAIMTGRDSTHVSPAVFSCILMQLFCRLRSVRR